MGRKSKQLKINLREYRERMHAATAEQAERDRIARRDSERRARYAPMD